MSIRRQRKYTKEKLTQDSSVLAKEHLVEKVLCSVFALQLCSDVDECSTEAHDCHSNATCTNAIGSFACRCLATFVGNGRNCIGKKFGTFQ